MIFDIDLTDVKELRDAIDKFIKMAEELNNKQGTSRAREIIEEMKLTKEQENLLEELFNE